MSKGHLDHDGFQIVKSKRSKKSTLPPKHLEYHKQEILVDVQKTTITE